MRTFKKIILAVMLVSLLCGTMAQAANIDTGRTCSFTIYDLYGTEETPVNGVTFSVSKVASVSYQGVYSLTDTYKSCNVTDSEINSIDHASDISGLLSKLTSVSDKDAKTGISDENGKLVIEGLSVGMYLVTAVDLETESGIYSSNASLIAIPEFQNNEWQYNVTVNVKTEKTAIEEETEGSDLPSAYSHESETEKKSYETDINTDILSEDGDTEGLTESASGSVQTGDDIPVSWDLFLFIIAFFAFIVSCMYRKQKQ